MGMFDELICEFALPEGFEKYQHEVFQTKDLGNCCDLYRITKTGELVLERMSEDVVLAEERTANLWSLGDQEITTAPTKLNFTGGIYFYHWNTESDFFFDIFAWFKDGKLGAALEVPKFTQGSLK